MKLNNQRLPPSASPIDFGTAYTIGILTLSLANVPRLALRHGPACFHF